LNGVITRLRGSAFFHRVIAGSSHRQINDLINDGLITEWLALLLNYKVDPAHLQSIQ
jgi:hypothetical protein